MEYLPNLFRETATVRKNGKNSYKMFKENHNFAQKYLISQKKVITVNLHLYVAQMQ